MVKLRLKRMGTIDKPFYRIVAVDSRKKRDGKYIEALGYYDPKTDPLTLKVDIEKSLQWLGKGAQPSVTVKSLLKKAGVMEKFHELKSGVKTEKTEKPEKKEEPVEETGKDEKAIETAETEQKAEEGVEK